jgi:hypothetical protein
MRSISVAFAVKDRRGCSASEYIEARVIHTYSGVLYEVKVTVLDLAAIEALYEHVEESDSVKYISDLAFTTVMLSDPLSWSGTFMPVIFVETTASDSQTSDAAEVAARRNREIEADGVALRFAEAGPCEGDDGWRGGEDGGRGGELDGGGRAQGRECSQQGYEK